ncbi:MAG: 4-hydroxythreonine-4-phosphate dehydrogenase PdxA [Phycisphaerales bacterium]
MSRDNTIAIDTPTLAITAGDPLGIGPEVTVKALAALAAAGTTRGCRVLLFGHEPTLVAAAGRAGIEPMWSQSPGARVQLVHRPFNRPAGAPRPTPEGGRHSFDVLTCAIEACKREPGESGSASAIVTAPIAKEAWSAAGIHYPGHTEVLAHEFASPRSAMLFVGPSLRVILVTTHIPLARVPRALSTARVLECIELGDQACREQGIAAPRIAVAGLNPHAGEHGVLGEEDDRVIAPAVAAARAGGADGDRSPRIDATGPLPGDSVFLAAARGRFDLVVAIYHDQGLIPVKLLDRERAVNVTVGLSWEERRIIRTSPAHGTAFDIAGTGRADPSSMEAAIALAASLATQASD